jgi:hypothetical protein
MSAATSTVDQRIWLHSLPAPGWPPTRIGWASTPITSAHRQHRQAVESTACAGTSPPEPLSNEAAQAAHADVTRPANRDGGEQSGFCDRSAVSPLSCAPARSESQLSPKTPPIPPEYDGIEYGGLPVARRVRKSVVPQRDLAELAFLGRPGTGPQHVDGALLPPDRVEQTVQIVQVGRISLHAGHVPADQLDASSRACCRRPAMKT